MISEGLGIVIAGSGGQGILLLGRLIAYAAMLAGRHVTWFPSYGAEMRGGTANCTVIISHEPIGSPIVRTSDMLLVFNCPSLFRFMHQLRNRGHLFYDSSQVSEEKCSNVNFEVLSSQFDMHRVRALEEAKELGSTRFANMVMFGAFLRHTFLSDLSEIEQVLRAVVPARHHSLISKNLKAVEKGYSSVANQKSSY